MKYLVAYKRHWGNKSDVEVYCMGFATMVTETIDKKEARIFDTKKEANKFINKYWKDSGYLVEHENTN